jgi:hypothetical protein
MMALKWMDKRPVCMLTTIQDDSMMTKVRRTRRVEGGQEEIRKPVVVEEYNNYMGGVDKSDQLLSYYGFSHRRVKWWKRAAFHLLDMAVVNAYILYSTSTQSSKNSHTSNFGLSWPRKCFSWFLSTLAKTRLRVMDDCSVHSLPSHG